MLCIANIFPFCKFGTFSVEWVYSVGEFAYASTWYALPPKQQTYVRLIIQYSHIPRKVTGFGIVRCSLETYINVIVAATDDPILLSETLIRCLLSALAELNVIFLDAEKYIEITL